MQKRPIRFILCTILIIGILAGCNEDSKESAPCACFVNGMSNGYTIALQPHLNYVIFYAAENDVNDEISSTRKEVISLTQKCMEAHLPNITMVCEWLPPYVELRGYDEGDIGNDGINDIAVLVYVNPEESDYYDNILLLFSEKAEAYELVSMNDQIVGYGDNVEIADGKLYLSENGGPQDYECNSYVFEKRGEELILCEFTEKIFYEHTAQGKRIVYDCANGKAEAYAFSTRENGFEPWLLFTAEAQIATPSLDEINKDCLPKLIYTTMEHTPESKMYDYHELPIEEIVAGRELSDWQQAYLDLFQYFMLEEFEENGWYYENILFSFKYIDDDDIPELVMELENHFTSVYAYTSGAEYHGVQNISVIMNGWGLRGGIGSRCYLPYENLFCFEYYGYDGEYEASYRRFWYATTSDGRDDLEQVYDLCRREYEGDYATDEDNVIKYYCNDEEISKEKYESYRIEGDYDYLGGNKYIYEMIDEMLEL